MRLFVKDIMCSASGDTFALTLSKVSAPGYMQGHQISRKIGIDFVTIAIREVSNLQVGRFWGVYSQPDSHTSPATRKGLLPKGGIFSHLKIALAKFALCVRCCNCG